MKNQAPTNDGPLWRKIYIIATLAALFSAIYKSMDNVTVHNFITAEDDLTAAFSYLILGSWAGVFSSLLYAKLFGKRLIDEKFTKIVIKNQRMHIYAAVSGAISAGSTLFSLWGNQLGDPSMLVALGNAVIIYTLFFEVITKQMTLRYILFPALFVLIGSFMASFGGSIHITLKGILFVLVLSNGLTAVSEIVSQKGVRISDAVSFFVWRFFWLATTGTILALGVSIVRGTDYLLFKTLAEGISYLPWIIFTMFFVFLGIGMTNYAKKHISVTDVLLITSIQIIIAFPITLLGNKIWPGIFGEIPENGWLWMIRMVGATLMVLGILTYWKRKKDEA